MPCPFPLDKSYIIEVRCCPGSRPSHTDTIAKTSPTILYYIYVYLSMYKQQLVVYHRRTHNLMDRLSLLSLFFFFLFLFLLLLIQGGMTSRSTTTTPLLHYYTTQPCCLWGRKKEKKKKGKKKKNWKTRPWKYCKTRVGNLGARWPSFVMFTLGAIAAERRGHQG